MALEINPVLFLKEIEPAKSGQRTSTKRPIRNSHNAEDRIELSKNAVSLPASDLTIQAIKDKIKGGYYQSEQVMDDISDKLAKLFDRL
ncbi:MAG: hypothetical protein A2293_08835 [Elusimicrobia bacterium RIFOXYB2_FULL_49_7]|nr:MAG: hypothetical protein A2293_08835 [Elusimicrobia bacterium RIFOXYB2_FULL_49_7]